MPWVTIEDPNSYPPFLSDQRNAMITPSRVINPPHQILKVDPPPTPELEVEEVVPMVVNGEEDLTVLMSRLTPEQLQAFRDAQAHNNLVRHPSIMKTLTEEELGKIEYLNKFNKLSEIEKEVESRFGLL